MNNELYIGRLVFNRLAYRKNPISERRVSRLNSPEQHIVQEVPQLRIVSDALWRRVKRRQANWKGADARRLTGKSSQSPKPKAGGARPDAAYDKRGERACKVRTWIDSIEFARLDQRSDNCPVLCSGIMTREERVLAIEGNRPDSSLNAVIVDLDAAVDQE